MKKIFLLLSFFCSFNVFANNIKTLKGSCDTKISAPLFSIQFQKEDEVLVTVNSNQIYILAKVHLLDGNKYDFTFVKTKDLGRGGMMLPWDNFSHKKKIMQLTKIGDTSYSLEWFGFWDVLEKKYTWSIGEDSFSGPDLNQKITTFYHCDKS